MNKPFPRKPEIVAEIGVNHNGSLTIAKKLIRAAAECGVDTVKFQTFKTNQLVLPGANLANYQISSVRSAKNQYDLLKKYELNFTELLKLQRFTLSMGLKFLTSVFDFESFNFAINDLNQERIKLGSGEITNYPLIYSVGKFEKFLILSTGNSTFEEITKALAYFALGQLRENPKKLKNISFFIKSNEFKLWLKNKSKNLILLQCTSSYPTPFQEVNLLSMIALRDKFCVEVGFSDHTTSYHSAYLATALGACFIEKHFTLSKWASGPDHKSSANKKQMKEYVIRINQSLEILGSYEKVPSQSEFVNKRLVRKGLYAARNLARGTILKKSDLLLVRPESGTDLSMYWKLIGTKLSKPLEQYEKIDQK